MTRGSNSGILIENSSYCGFQTSSKNLLRFKIQSAKTG